MTNDNMVNKKGEIIINNNLLNIDFWEKEPEVVHKTIKDIAIKNIKNELTFVCKKYLSLTNSVEYIKDSCPNKSNHFLLVLGKSLNSDGSMNETLINRLKCTLDLFSKDSNIKILTSGGGLKLEFSEAETMKNWLVKNGVPETSIILESKSSDTMENIIYSTNILVKKRASEVTLITSEDHIQRSCKLLSLYKQKNNLTFTLNQISSKKSEIDGYFSKNKENFILFKDIGRILNLWDYENNILPQPICESHRPKGRSFKD